MKFLTVRELRGNCAKVWKELPGEMEMVVTNNGKPVAIFSSVAESNLEESLSSIHRARHAGSAQHAGEISTHGF